MRVYISVVCMLAWPSHRETLRKSLVACKTVSAQVCLSTCGDTRLLKMDGQSVEANLACFRNIYWKPDRGMASPLAFMNTSGVATDPLTANQYFTASAAPFHKAQH